MPKKGKLKALIHSVLPKSVKEKQAAKERSRRESEPKVAHTSRGGKTTKVTAYEEGEKRYSYKSKNPDKQKGVKRKDLDPKRHHERDQPGYSPNPRYDDRSKKEKRTEKRAYKKGVRKRDREAYKRDIAERKSRGTY